MKYTIENWNERTVFVFEKPIKSFEEVSEIIEKNIKPDFQMEIEVTSWTVAFVFSKNNTEIYFEYYDYMSDSHFSFEHFPIGRCPKSDFAKIKAIIDELSIFLIR